MRIIINDVVTYTFDFEATQLARELHITLSKLEALSDDELWDQVANTWPLCERIWRDSDVTERTVAISR